MKKQIVLLALMMVLSSTIMYGHGNVIYNVDLDFDKELKSNVVKSAQSYLNIDEEPVGFDFDRELISVKFDRDLEYSVRINPLDNSVFGFRDDSLVNRHGETKYGEKERKVIAQKIFDSIPEDYKSELKYGEEKKLYSGTFQHTWYRYVDGIYVSGNHLEVEIDALNGDVVAWRLSIFFYPKTQIQTTPFITYKVAQQIAELRFNADPVDFNPILIIEKNKLVWVTKVKSLYPHFVAIDASDGEVLYSGSLRGDLPENYDYGREVEVIETEFINKIYNN